MMGRAKQLGGELLGSSIKKDKSERRGGEMSDTKAMKEALKLAKHKDLKQIDPRVLDYAASKVQAGFRGWQARQNLKKGL